MRTLLAIILALACGAPGAARAADQPPPLPALPGQGGDQAPAPGQDAMPPAEIRVIRDVQAKAYGAPSLPLDAAKPDALLALSDLGSMAVSNDPGAAKLQQEDYDALFALLQRYRDDLLKMGMDSAELQAQMEGLQSRTSELELRLKNLLPKDGLKITGRFFSVFDDLHLIGPAVLPNAAFVGGIEPDGSGGPLPKSNGSGVRSQMGVAHVGLMMDGTRGPVSGHVQMDFLTLWGFDQVSLNIRKVWVQWRLPVVLDVGDLDGSLSPLTLWRNDQYEPFEPLIFQDRRKRMEDDLLLSPDQWPLTGVRASTDMLLFGSTRIHIQSLTGIAAYAQGSAAPYGGNSVYLEPQPKPTGFDVVTANDDYAGPLNYLSLGNTYYEGWRLGAGLGSSGTWSVAYNGLFFWDDLATAPGLGIYVPMTELVQSAELKYQSGGLSAGLEAALSGYQPPCMTGTAQARAGAMTGTAVTFDAAWTADKGHVRIYGRYVTSGFYSAGAQGRTVDYNYQVGGPFLTENSQLGTNGMVGMFPAGNAAGIIVPESYESRLNNRLIPPGIITTGARGAVFFNPWRNLIAFGPGEEIDPYGPATPNRMGGGLEGTWKFFKGGLIPLAGADFASEIDPVSGPTADSGTASASLPAFTMTRYRAGLMVDLQPWFGWAIRFGGGMTLTDSTDGAKGPLMGNTYDLGTNTTEGGLDWRAGQPWGASLGYRHMTAVGQDETFFFTPGQTQEWDIAGAGFWWRPQDQMSLDLNYTQAHSTPLGQAAASLEIDQIVARLTMEF